MQNSSLSDQLSSLIKNQNDSEVETNDIDVDIDVDTVDEDQPMLEDGDVLDVLDSTSEVDESDMESDIYNEVNQDSEVRFEIAPFAGLIDQSITIIASLDSAKDIEDFNFQNPFSKKQGYFREMLNRIKPYMNNFANKDMLILTSNILDCKDALKGMFVTNINTVLEDLFGGQKSNVNVEIHSNVKLSESGTPKILIDTLTQVKFPALAKAKNDSVLNNTFVYFDRLAESMPKIKINLILGFSTLQLVDANIRPIVVSNLLEMVADGNTTMFVPSQEKEKFTDVDLSNFDLVFTKSWND